MTARTLVAFLPAVGGTAIAWQLWEENDRCSAPDHVPPPADDLAVHGVAPPESVVLHRLDLPDLAPNQARAAAALLAAEASAAAPLALHVALGDDGGADRPMAVVDPTLMAGWIAALAAVGHAARSISPAPLLIAAPPEGSAHRAAIGPFAAIRTASGGFADDALAPLMLADRALVTIAATPLPAAIAACPVDLLQGRFARRRRRIDGAALRRMARLAAIALLLVLATQLVLIARHRLAADAARDRAAALAATVLPATDRGGDGQQRLERRLAAIEGPGGGFARLLRPVLDTLARAPVIDLESLDYGTDGALRISLVGPDAGQLSAVANAIQARGVRVALGESGAVGARTRAAFTVSAP